MSAGPEPVLTARRGDVPAVVVALVVAAALSIALGIVARSRAVSGAPQLLLADLVVWIPLGLAVWWAVRGMRRRQAADRLGLRVGPWFSAVDIVLGVAIALVARVFDAFLELGLTGDTGLHPTPVLAGVATTGLAALTIIGPCIVSPILEELTFRGVFQRAMAARNGGGVWGQASAVLIAAFVFALAHLVFGSALGPATVFTTFLLGLLVGALTAATGRIGGAIVAHIVFNVVAVVLTWSF